MAALSPGRSAVVGDDILIRGTAALGLGKSAASGGDSAQMVPRLFKRVPFRDEAHEHADAGENRLRSDSALAHSDRAQSIRHQRLVYRGQRR